MSKRLLIDAFYPEESRVAVVSDGVIREFDHESVAHKPLKGNIYLAKIVRVEASLQAAFVDYGGNRDGFLPFNDIHPDYYKIPIADRDDRDDRDDEVSGNSDQDRKSEDSNGSADSDGGGEPVASGEYNGFGEDSPQNIPESDQDEDRPDSGAQSEIRSRRYRIQEVIRRNQIILVQIVKEERGAKGAALTTQLSLAGRYCVLMPNASRGGGVSRKISNISDRRKIRLIVDSLDIPEGMAVIIRTAGHNRTKAEIRRDYSYLMRLWGEIRERTLQSTAPCLINEEGDLVKRSIRDLYDRDMEEVLVNEESAYRMAKETMRMLMPSHAKRVKFYKEKAVPLFNEYHVEQQLDSIFSPRVDLQSGGYLIINQAEALVAIDVNSGRSTKERSIEETAVRTNLEAAEEISWQLRLRDLAGLIVVDFIDMNDRRNQAKVENHFKEALKTDRARTQVGKLSIFGLLEMSRQRLRPSLTEMSTTICPACKGNGFIRSVDSLGLQVLRILEDQAVSADRSGVVTAFLSERLSSYVLNQKRSRIVEIENRHAVQIVIVSEAGTADSDYRIDVESSGRSKTTTGRTDSRSSLASGAKKSGISTYGMTGDDRKNLDALPDDGVSENQGKDSEEEGKNQERRGRRRGKRGGRRRRPPVVATDATPETTNVPEETSSVSPPGEEKSARDQENGQSSVIPETGGDQTVAGPEKKKSPAEKRPRRRRTAAGKSPQSKAAQSRPAQSDVTPATPQRPTPQRPAASAVDGSGPEGQGTTPPGKKKTGWWQGFLNQG